MSAIFAILHHDGRPSDPADLARMADALAPLGPERSAVWHAGPIGLGHCLMSFTPADTLERQPLLSADGRLALVFDGRLDNRPELAAAFGLSPAEAAALPDSALVLRAFETWGAASPAHLIGGLAFIVWDAPKRRLFAASTPGNDCTLFYHQTPARLALASMPRGLLALPGVPRRLNQRRLAEFLLYSRPSPSSATYFADLLALRGGHSLTAEAGAVQVRQYWAPDLNRQLRFARDDDYVAAFNELFERVIADHLRSLTPVAAMLSSGLDSTAVAVTAADQLLARGQTLATYTSVPDPRSTDPIPPDRFSDESGCVLAIARQHTNLQPEIVATDGQFFLGGLAGRLDHHNALPGNHANFVWIDAILGRARAAGQRVVLCGSAGNFVMSWAGDGLAAHYLRRGRLAAAWREAGALAAVGRSRSRWRALLNHGLLPFLPDPLWAAVERHRQRIRLTDETILRPGFAAALGLPALITQLAPRARLHPDGRQQRLSYALGRSNPQYPAWRSQFGVDVRDPSGDQRLIEFCLALPHDQFQRGGQPRWLIRRAMAGRLPPEVLANPQRGLQSADWLFRLRAHRAQVAQTLARLEQDELAARALNLERLRALVDSWPDAYAAGPSAVDEYRLLQDGLAAGEFILWARAAGLQP